MAGLISTASVGTTVLMESKHTRRAHHNVDRGHRTPTVDTTVLMEGRDSQVDSATLTIGTEGLE